MEQYEYQIITKEECMFDSKQLDIEVFKESEEIETVRVKVFDAAKFENKLIACGEAGFRVIKELYNSPHDWVLVLSRLNNPTHNKGRHR